MPIPIPEGKRILVEKRRFPAEYCMPTMEMAVDHYNIGYTISGDRKTITPTHSYSYHSGNVSMISPYSYHKTVSQSSVPYESYLIKFTEEFIRPFIDNVGKNVFDQLYEQKICCFLPEVQPKIQAIFEEMFLEYKKEAYYKEFVLQGMLCRLFTEVWENKLETESEKYSSPLTKPIFDAVCYIESSYYENITLEGTAAMVHLSNSYFSKLFAEQLKSTFTQYLCNVRIRHAKVLLAQTDKSIMEIALDVGYCHGNYLSAQFKSKTGMTPSQFRQKMKSDK